MDWPTPPKGAYCIAPKTQIFKTTSTKTVQPKSAVLMLGGCWSTILERSQIKSVYCHFCNCQKVSRSFKVTYILSVSYTCIYPYQRNAINTCGRPNLPTKLVPMFSYLKYLCSQCLTELCYMSFDRMPILTGVTHLLSKGRSKGAV